MSADAVKLQVRMERSLKEEAEEVFAAMGLDTTTAVRIFFTKVAKTRSIPFRLNAEPEFTPAQEARILEAWEESKDPRIYQDRSLRRQNFSNIWMPKLPRVGRRKSSPGLQSVLQNPRAD